MTHAANRLTDRVEPWVQRAIYSYLVHMAGVKNDALGDEVIYDIAFQAFPDDTGQFFGQIAIYLQIPGLEPDTSFWAMPILSPLGITEGAVHEAIRQALKDMFAEREKQQPQTEATD